MKARWEQVKKERKHFLFADLHKIWYNDVY